MSRSSSIVAILAAGTWFSLLTPPAPAQIASYVDDHGKHIYVNDDSTVTHQGGTTSPAPAASSAQPPDRLERIVRDAAARHRMDPALLKAVISAESGWNPQAVSRKGAVGLMQLIPGTAQRYGVGNPYDPVQNVEGGTLYLKSLLNRYNGNLVKTLAAYNAGEHAVDQSGGVPAIPETRRYVQKVTDAYFRPESDRDTTLWDPPKPHVRREVDSRGRVVYTNE